MSHPPMLENILGQPASHQSVLDLHRTTHQQLFAECARVLRGCGGRIILSGMGASYFALLPATTYLEEQGYRVQAMESAELVHYGRHGLRAGDLGVLVSRSGGSTEVVSLAAAMRAARMTVIGITNKPDGELGSLCDVSLPVGAHPDQMVAVQTYTGTLLLLLLLAREARGRDAERLANVCLASLPALAESIAQSLESSEDWRDFLDQPEPLYLLGRGPALAAVHEGVLLLHETAKAAAVGMSSGQFRHGPVEVVSRRFRAIVLGSPLPTRALDAALAGDLSRMGAQVRWIGPAQRAESTAEANPVVSLGGWPKMAIAPEEQALLAPLFEIVPLQVAAYRLALWRGITPGEFRYASEVTTGESGFPRLEAKLARV